jgi:PKD repeat protein
MTANDPDDNIESWELDIDNDGTPEYQEAGEPPNTIQHSYQNSGTYTAKLTVTDDQAASAEDTVEDIVVSPIEPELSLSFKRSIGKKIKLLIKNTGDIDVSDVNYTITIKGGLFKRIDKTISNTIPSLAIDEEKVVEEKAFGLGKGFGFGRVQITASVDHATTETTEAFVLGTIVILL